MDACFDTTRHTSSRTRLAPAHTTWRIWLLPLAAAACLTTSAAAQLPAYTAGTPTPFTLGGGSPPPPPPLGTIVTDHRSKDWDLLNYGFSQFGGSVGADAEATRSYVSFPSGATSASNYDSAAGLYSKVKVFGSPPNGLEVVRLGATAENEKYTLSPSGAAPKANYKAKTTIFLQLVGFTVWSDSAEGVTLSKTWSASFGPYNTPTVSASFALGPIPFTVSAYAGASGSASLTVTADLAAVALQLSGNASGAVYGVGSFGVGISVFSAGIQINLKFGNPVITPTLTGSLFTGLSATLQVCVTPIIFTLKLYATIKIWKIKKTWTADIFSWSAPQICDTFVL